jgi:rhodanese-related sulfurtransferase
MTLKIGIKDLLEAAEREIQTLVVDEARALHGREDVQFVDLRDIRELQREGRIPGAFHATRGMLEFWIDPDSPYYKDVFGQDKTFVFYCQSGWRSALATQTVQRMGLPKVCHIGGGYRAWKEAGGVTEALPPRN